MGELHLDIIKDRILKEHKLEIDLDPLQIAYREALIKKLTDSLTVETKIASSKQSITVQLTMQPMDSSKLEDVLKFDKSPESAKGELEDEFAIDWDFLDELIRIYMTYTPDDYMHSDVGPMPWIKYIDILEALIYTRDWLKANGPPPRPGVLEQTMIDWLQQVAPELINEKTLQQIHEYACAVGDKLRKDDWPEELVLTLQITHEEEEAPPPPPIAEVRAEAIEPPETVMDEEQLVEEGGDGTDGQVVEEEEEEEKEEEEKERGPMILGHVPSFIQEHSPDAICCLSLKIWAVWLLEVCHNAHTWTKWMHEVIRQIREFAATVRGEVRLPNGDRKVLYREEWRKFVQETEEKICYWMDYSGHVKELSDSIIKNFHGKPVYCCPKCLQDHLIKNVCTAHETLAALCEAMNMAQYWRKCLDSLVATTAALTDLDDLESSSSSSVSTVELEEVTLQPPCVPCPGKPKPCPPTTSSGEDEPEDETEDDYDDSEDDGTYYITHMDPRIQRPDCDCI